MQQLIQVYVALGGNIGDTQSILTQALQQISALPNVQHLECSRFYRTPPVSPIPQASYINAVCRFQTSLSAKELLHALQRIETALGKVPKAKEAPRCIDLDILFFGAELHRDAELVIPHPRWRERLFVLLPLLDLTTTIELNDGEDNLDIASLLKGFSKIDRSKIVPL